MLNKTNHLPAWQSVRKGFLLLAVLLTCLALPRLHAQSDLASIRGSVQDQTGAALPGASVLLTSLDTGLTQSAVADAEGNFHFEALVRGSYQAKVTANGFQATAQKLTLNVSQIQAINFKLKPGSVNTTVEVTDAAPIVDTSTSSTGTVVEAAQVSELPLNGRNLTQLALLVPGITRGAYGSDASGVSGNAETWRNGDTGGAALSANGLRQQANNFELDGLDNNDAMVNTIVFMSPVDNTEEFRVTNSVAPAEFGHAGGAIVQNSIKSGTNQFHGSAFFFDRDKIFDANPNYRFGSSTATPAPSFHKVQYGGSLGGPLWHDRLFMFGGFQGMRLKQPESQAINSVPTPLMRTGDFSELLTSQSGIPTVVPNQTVTGCTTTAVAGAIYDPLTCQQFGLDASGQKIGALNVIPSGRLNKAALNYLNAFPLPNHGPDQGNYSLTNNYYSNPALIQHFDDFDVRVDYKATSKDNVFARYSYGQDIQVKGSQYPNLPAGYGSGYNPIHPRGEAVGETHMFSSNMVNEFRYGHIYDFFGYVPPMDNIPVSANLGILNANRNSLLGGGAAINTYGSASGYAGGNYTGDGGAYTVPQSANQFVDALTWTKRQHTFKFGASIEKRQVSFFSGNNSKGNFYFGDANFTGEATADMLAAFVDSYSIGVASSNFVTKNWETGYYVQDDWKLNHRLTLNLGFRYDLYTFPYEQHNYQSNFDLATQTLQVAGTNGLSKNVVKTNKNDFAPRVGFAYDVYGNGKTSLRGGYGMYYFMDRGGVGNALSNNPDFNGAANYSAWPTNGGYRINFTGQAPINDNNSADATAALPLPVFGSTVDRSNPANANVISVSTTMPTSMIHEWNLQLQQQLTQQTSVNIAYVGTLSEHLDNWFNLNGQIMAQAPNAKLYPKMGSIDRGLANGSSNYNGLQVYLNSRLAHGFQYTASYTWSHALDNSNSAFGSGTSGTGVFILANGPSFKDNYGNSDQDQRQVFTFSGMAELPFGRGKRFASHIPLALDEAVGGWKLNTITTLSSGTPVTVTTGNYYVEGSTSLSGSSLTNRADLVKPVHYTKSLHEWFDPTSFAHPSVITPNGQQSTFSQVGTSARNMLAGPGHADLDLSLFKEFTFTQKLKGEFRAEAFNVTNTPAFTNPNGNLDSCNGYAGTSCSVSKLGSDNGSFSQINGVRQASERQLQLAMRFTF